MTNLYTKPFRVYLVLGFLALVGLYSGYKLPVSLFPNSSKAIVMVRLSYGSFTPEEFKNSYGDRFERQLQNISSGKTEVESLEAEYSAQIVNYTIKFKWGTESQEALKEVQSLANSFASQFPLEVRDSLYVDSWSENTGFLAISFFSAKRSMDELYDYLDPIFSPQLAKIKDASEAALWNPAKKEIQISLDPQKMALFGLYPRDIATALDTALNGSAGGIITVGLNQHQVIEPRQIGNLDEIGRALIPTANGAIHLDDVGHADFGLPLSNTRSFRTSGAPSLLMFADPKPGGNIKRMAEDVLTLVSKTMPTLPSDIHYKVLVDPSEFINSSVNNVLKEVIVAALLAVGVLFLFVGNIKNVATAAIEIPLSIVLAFVLMKIFGINLNLISLGGLALSAGMNVDASVVVMENIFRKFGKEKGHLSYADRFRLVCEAVNEVKFPVIASTIASLVVFLPLAFTSGLSNALLGDLALAVVFSHSFSAVIALILVPTVRLHLMSKGEQSETHAPIERYLIKIETFYVKNLDRFLNSFNFKNILYGLLSAALVLLIFFVLPRLPKEIIGRPDTDWIFMAINTQGNTLVKQMENKTEEIESRLMSKFGDKFAYTFVQNRQPNNATIMGRLKDKSQMTAVWHEVEKYFVNTPEISYYIGPWNPSELSIPNLPDLKIRIRGADNKARSDVAQRILEIIQDKKLFQNLSTVPAVYHRDAITIHPHIEQWPYLMKDGGRLLPSDLADISRVADMGRKVGYLAVAGRVTPVTITYHENSVATMEDLAAFPIGIKGKLLSMHSLADIQMEEAPDNIFSLDQKPVVTITTQMSDEEKAKGEANAREVTTTIKEWLAHHPLPSGISVNFEDAKVEMNDALHELERALALSVLLIFVTMILQFGDVMNALFVLVAVPLGFIGVLASLAVFKSTLSLNSVLGVILLNGIAVANSIILVDFMKKLVEKGVAPRQAALQAAKARLRPILMTSLTTALGMLPVALGLGEGGRILQPLGIAVVGGLGFSMLTTLIIVPALQTSYLEWRNRKKIQVEYNFSRDLQI